MENTEHIENRRIGLHLIQKRFVLENGGEYRTHREQENGGIQSSWVTLILKFVLENGGEYRAHIYRTGERWNTI